MEGGTPRMKENLQPDWGLERVHETLRWANEMEEHGKSEERAAIVLNAEISQRNKFVTTYLSEKSTS